MTTHAVFAEFDELFAQIWGKVCQIVKFGVMDCEAKKNWSKKCERLKEK